MKSKEVVYRVRFGGDEDGQVVEAVSLIQVERRALEATTFYIIEFDWKASEHGAINSCSMCLTENQIQGYQRMFSAASVGRDFIVNLVGLNEGTEIDSCGLQEGEWEE